MPDAHSSLPLLSTTVVGSYPQPGWLIDREKLVAHNVPRVRARDIWRVPEPFLEQAQDDATRLAIDDMERAGVDVITDGEIRRESYSNRFAAELEGVESERPVTISPRPGRFVQVPRVTGPIRRTRPLELRDIVFLRRNTSRLAKITLPGPFTLAQQAADEFYGEFEALASAFAEAVNAEALELQAAGADVIQLDEPWLRADPDAARRLAIRLIDRAFEGVTVTKAIHLCFGYGFVVQGDKPRAYPFLEELAQSSADQISIEAAQPDLDLSVLSSLGGKTVALGVLDLSTAEAETPEIVAGRLRAALRHLPAEQLVAAPDCGMKYLPRAAAFAKLKAMCEGAAIVRRELAGGA
jgi:5-methyltetrahydropteroyltriglutamate--homocysteine methyltransferase